MKDYVEKKIACEVKKLGLKRESVNTDLYSDILDVIKMSINGYMVETGEFLTEVAKYLTTKTGKSWIVKQNSEVNRDVIEEVCPATYMGKAKIYYRYVSDLITSNYLVSEDTDILFSQKRDSCYTDMKLVNESAFEYVNLYSLSQMTDDEYYDVYRHIFIQLMEKDMGKVEESIIDGLQKKYEEMLEKKDNDSELIRKINDKIKKCNSQIGIYYSERAFDSYDSSFFSREYENEKLPDYSEVEYTIDSYNLLTPVNKSMLKLVEDKNGIANGYNVTAVWRSNWSLSEDVQDVHINAPEELFEILKSFEEFFNDLKIQYELIGEEKYYNRVDYYRKFYDRGFQTEKGILVKYFHNDQEVDKSFVRKKINKVSTLVKQLQARGVSSITKNDIFDKIYFGPDGFEGTEASREGFIENGWVEGETSTWLGDIINNFLEPVEKRIEILKLLLMQCDKNKQRVEFFNNRAIFYDKLYKSYGKKLRVEDKLTRLCTVREVVLHRHDNFQSLENLLITNGALANNPMKTTISTCDDGDKVQLVKKRKIST